MIELPPSVLEAIERLEANPEAIGDPDLFLLREYFEDILPARDQNRIVTRFVSDSEFCWLAIPVFVANIHARARTLTDFPIQPQ